MSGEALPLVVLPLHGSTKPFRIMPLGNFKAFDGRPENGTWLLTAQRGAQMVAEAKLRSNDYVIDYEHQTQLSERNGQPAPAAGWFHRLEMRNDGLYITDARWTDDARRMIEAQKYRFVSPVFAFDKTTGEVQRLVSLGLTNDPGLHGLTDLAVLRALQPTGDLSAPAAEAASFSAKDVEYMDRVFGPGTVERSAAAVVAKEAEWNAPPTERDRAQLRAAFPDLNI